MRAERAARILAFIAATSAASPALAHCRTTTCDVGNPDSSCHEGLPGCAPLYWQNGCTWFGVQEDGSKKRGISHDVLHARVAQAFVNWGAIDCGGGLRPAFAIEDTDALYGAAVCSDAFFNKPTVEAGVRANANVWMFRDANWPYGDSTTTIALTTVTVDLTPGHNYARILDADVEINSFSTVITTTPTNKKGEAFLDSIVAHESGHFLGLAHSAIETATMYAYYDPILEHSLTSDDTEGLCGVYEGASTPPSCPEPEPLYGFSRYCSGADASTDPLPVAGRPRACSCDLVEKRPMPWTVFMGAALALFARRRRCR